MLSIVEATDYLTLNFKDVLSASDGFVDEFFVALIANRGRDWFKSHIKVDHLDPEIRGEILFAVDCFLNPSGRRREKR